MIEIGDLVRWYSVQNDVQEEFDVDLGVVLRTSQSGTASDACRAEVMFWDGEIEWVNWNLLEKVSGNGEKKP